MKPILGSVAVVAALMLFACGPSARPLGGDDTVDAHSPGPGQPDASPIVAGCTPTGPEDTVATCSDGIDNDCNGTTDCDDPSCSGIGTCPVCGMVTHNEPAPFFLPDDPGGTPVPYSDTVLFSGFGPNQTMTAVSNIQSVCVTMEHSWLRDMEIKLISPSGQSVELQKFLQQVGGQVFMGVPAANDQDDSNPQVGVGWNYCWTPSNNSDSMNLDMLDYVDMTQCGSLSPDCETVAYTLPAGNYAAAGEFSDLLGATLNGMWSIQVTDEWEQDYGYIFSWTIAFDPSILTNCSTPGIQ